MKNVIDKSKKLIRQTQAVRDVLKRLPSAAGEINKIVETAAGAIHQIRIDAGAAMADLRIDDDFRFGDILKETTLAQEHILECGYFLSEVSLDLGTMVSSSSGSNPLGEVGRLIIRLRNVAAGSVGDGFARKFPRRYEDSKTLKAIFFAIERTSILSASISEFGLVPHEIQISVGEFPSIRVSWRNPVLDPQGETEEFSEAIQDVEFEGDSKTKIEAPSYLSQPETGFFPPTSRPRSPKAAEGEGQGATQEATQEATTHKGGGAATTETKGDSDPLAKFKGKPPLTKRATVLG
jgi:hypothetical protein